MPDFNFTISVPVHADMEPFKAEVRAGVEEATKGVNIGGGPAGPTAGAPRGRASATFSASEQAAVDRAMSHAQGALTPAGTYRLPGGYVPQGGFDPQGWRNIPQATDRGGSRYDPTDRIRDRFRSLSSRTENVLGDIAALRANDPAETHERIQDRVIERQERRADRQAERATRRSRGGFFGLPTSSFRGVLGLLGGAEVFGGLNASLIADTETTGGPLGNLQAQQQAIGRLTSGLFGSAIGGGINAIDLGLRAAGNTRGLGNYSLIGLNQAVEAAGQGVAAARAGAGRVANSLSIQEEITRANEAAYNIGTRGTYLRESDALHFRQRQFERGLDNDLGTLRAQYTAEQDPSRRNELFSQYSQLARNYGPRIDASRVQTNAELEDLRRQAGLRYRTSARSESALQAESEGRFGIAEDRRFAAELSERQAAADEDNPQVANLQRRLNLLATAGREARITSRARSLDRATYADNARLARAPEAAARIIELDDEERVALEESPAGLQASIRSRFGARRSRIAQQFKDQGYDINTSLDAAINQSALRTRGGTSNLLAADLDVIVQRGRAEALDLERAGLSGQSALTDEQRASKKKELAQAEKEYEQLYEEQQRSRRRPGGINRREQESQNDKLGDLMSRRNELAGDLALDIPGQRRRLAQQQVREFQADYYRSVRFEEVSGGRIAGGSGNPFRDVDAKFQKAAEDAGKRGAAEGGAGGGPSKEDWQQLVDLLRQFFNRNFRAKAG